LSRALAGSCQVPLGAHAEIGADRLRLRGFVASPDGRRMVADEVDAPVAGDPGELGLALADRLIARGAKAILAELEGAPQ
jgi:hydroxymethylbilane synthase